jgi:hypothetical protein
MERDAITNSASLCFGVLCDLCVLCGYIFELASKVTSGAASRK